MTESRRPLNAADLLHGDDHDFIINLYVAALGRWPDPPGYRHYRELIAGQPEKRAEVLRMVVNSEEARRLGHPVAMPERLLPGDPLRAREALLARRTEVLQAELEKLREGLALLAGPAGAQLETLRQEVAEAERAGLHGEIAALRRELRAALGPRPAPTAAEAARADLATGLAQLLDAYLAERLDGFETRLAALEARLGPG